MIIYIVFIPPAESGPSPPAHLCLPGVFAAGVWIHLDGTGLRTNRLLSHGHDTEYGRYGLPRTNCTSYWQ